MKRKISLILIIMLILSSNCFATTYGIEVNTKRCTVSVYQKIESFWLCIGTKKCCIGKNNSTPKGFFKIYNKKNYFKTNGKYYDFVSYFFDKCAFHSVPRINKKYDKSSLGHKYSNGCIRLSPEAAYWIYKHCKNGTKVIIR